jgi:PAS domain S-box-containing protein
VKGWWREAGGELSSIIENINQNDTLASFADQITDIVWKVNQDGSICYGNQHWLKFSGTNDVVASGCKFPFKEFIHHEDLLKLQTMWETSQVSLEQFSMEVRLLCAKDSSYVWHLLRAWPVLKTPAQTEEWSGNRSDVSHWLVICTDVHALKSTQNMFQLVMDNSPISIFWKDRNSTYLGCNKMCSIDMGAQSTEVVIGRNDYDNPSTREQSDFFVQCDRRVTESGSHEYHIIERQQRPGGVQVCLDTNKIPLRDAGGSVVGVLGMYEDITKRVLLEHQHEDFVATLTHDLKNPLLGTNRVLDLLVNGKLGPLGDSQKQVLNQLKESNTSLLDLIRNLLDVYKYDNIALLSDFQEVDLKQFLQESVARYQVAAGMREINLRFFMSDQSCLMKLNTQAMNRVLQNLIDNALKFAPLKGHVDVKASIFAKYCSIEVKDDGPGIELEDQKQLFHRFSQGTTGKKFSSGTGLGLFLCKQIVEAHKGSISCQSITSNGASFIVVLPINMDSPSFPNGNGA